MNVMLYFKKRYFGGEEIFKIPLQDCGLLAYTALSQKVHFKVDFIEDPVYS